MNWQEILTIILPIFALMGWVYSRIEKKADARHMEIKSELKDVKDEIGTLNNRLTRLEGRFDERGYWESREYHQRNGTEDKK